MLEVESEENEQETQDEKNPEPEEVKETKKWYETIPNLDVKIAISNSGSEEAFLSVLKIYYDSYPSKTEELNNYFDNEDWDNYTVKIHALKSSSRLVGAIELGDRAEKLEMAGKEGDIDYIKNNHAHAMQQYKDISDSLSDKFGTDEKSDLPAIDDATLSELYEGLSEFVAIKDLELARMVINSAAEYRLPPEDEERFKRLGVKVEQMNWDGICDILKEVE